MSRVRGNLYTLQIEMQSRPVAVKISVEVTQRDQTTSAT